jgi:hypothetical protein
MILTDPKRHLEYGHPIPELEKVFLQNSMLPIYYLEDGTKL